MFLSAEGNLRGRGELTGSSPPIFQGEGEHLALSLPFFKSDRCFSWRWSLRVPRQLPLVVRQAIIRRDDAVRRRIVELSRSRRARAPPLLLRQCVGTAQRWSWTFVSSGVSVDVVVAQVRSVSYLPGAWVIVAVSRSSPAAIPTMTTNFSGVPQGSSLSPVVFLEHADDSVHVTDDISSLAC